MDQRGNTDDRVLLDVGIIMDVFMGGKKFYRLGSKSPTRYMDELGGKTAYLCDELVDCAVDSLKDDYGLVISRDALASDLRDALGCYLSLEKIDPADYARSAYLGGRYQKIRPSCALFVAFAERLDLKMYTFDDSFAEYNEHKIKIEKIFHTNCTFTDRHGIDFMPSCPETSTSLTKLFEIGFKLSELGLYKEAIKYFDIGLCINPNDELMLSCKGRALSMMDMADAAIECYGLIDKSSTDCLALLNKGVTMYHMREFAEAMRCLDTARENCTDEQITADIHSYRGATLAALERFGEALDDHNDALSRGETYVRLFNKGHTLLYKKISQRGILEPIREEFEEILACLTRARSAYYDSVGRDSAVILSWLGLANHMTVDLSVTRDPPDDLRVIYDIMCDGDEFHDMARAADQSNDLVILNKSLVYRLFDKTDCWHFQDNDTKQMLARNRYFSTVMCGESGVRTDPGSAKPGLCDMSGFGAAGACIPGDYEIMVLRGAYLYKNGLYEDALRILGEAGKANPNSFRAAYYKGLALYKLGRRSDAKDCLDGARTIEPGPYVKNDVLDDLYGEDGV